MLEQEPVLHLVCGKIASGKSTLTRALAANTGAVRLSEDEWLAALFGDQMTSLPDFVRCSAKLRDVMEPHILDLLAARVSVVMDFQANTIDGRQWLRSLVDRSGVEHVLHYLDVPDVECKARLARRNASGKHEFHVTEAQFDDITSHFVPPSEDEGFKLVVHRFEP